MTLPLHGKASNLRETFNHLSDDDLFSGASFVERSTRGYPSASGVAYYLGRTARILGRGYEEWAAYAPNHPQHFIAGHSQEQTDCVIAVISLQGGYSHLPLRKR